MPLLANFLVFQIGWFACVLGGANGLPWVGTGIALAIVAWHLTRAVRPKQELLLVLSAAAIGALFDSLLVALGWLAYPSGTLIAGTAPHWIVALWMLFAITLNLSLAWLKRRLLIAVGAAVGDILDFHDIHPCPDRPASRSPSDQAPAGSDRACENVPAAASSR